MRNHKKFWVGLNIVKGMGAVRLRALLDTFGDAQSSWLAPPESLLAIGLPGKIVDNLVKLRASVSLDEIWASIQAQGIRVLIWDDEDYQFVCARSQMHHRFYICVAVLRQKMNGLSQLWELAA